MGGTLPAGPDGSRLDSKDDIDTGLVPDKPIGSFGNGEGAAAIGMDQKTERVRRVGEPARQLPAGGKLAQRGFQPLRLGEDVAHHEHQ